MNLIKIEIKYSIPYQRLSNRLKILMMTDFNKQTNLFENNENISNNLNSYLASLGRRRNFLLKNLNL